MKLDTLIKLLSEMAAMVDRPGGAEGGGAILLMAADELDKRRWVPPIEAIPDIRQSGVPTSH